VWFVGFYCYSGVRAGVICTSSLTQCSVPLTAEARVRSHMVFMIGRVGLGQVSLKAPQLSVSGHQCSVLTLYSSVSSALSKHLTSSLELLSLPFLRFGLPKSTQSKAKGLVFEFIRRGNYQLNYQ